MTDTTDTIDTTEFTRKIVFRPAFDKRDPNPRKNYGIHGMEMCFQLIGDAGGITFTIYTNWHLPHVQAELDAKNPSGSKFPYLSHTPTPAGVDGHWKTPAYEGQSEIDDCKITGGKCYCDGSGLLAEDVFRLLVTEGEEAVWKFLETKYNDWKPSCKHQ